MYAIIATGGKQYKVSEGDVIRVEKLGVEAGSAYTFDQVLMVGGDEVKVGEPLVAGATVEASVLEDGKEKKITDLSGDPAFRCDSGRNILACADGISNLIGNSFCPDPECTLTSN